MLNQYLLLLLLKVFGSCLMFFGFTFFKGVYNVLGLCIFCLGLCIMFLGLCIVCRGFVKYFGTAPPPPPPGPTAAAAAVAPRRAAPPGPPPRARRAPPPTRALGPGPRPISIMGEHMCIKSNQ